MFRRQRSRGSRAEVVRRAQRAGRISARSGRGRALRHLACRRARYPIRISAKACRRRRRGLGYGRQCLALVAEGLECLRDPLVLNRSVRRGSVLQVNNDRVVEGAADLLDPLVVVARRMHAIRQDHDIQVFRRIDPK